MRESTRCTSRIMVETATSLMNSDTLTLPALAKFESSTVDLTPGMVIKHYEVIRKLGAGGMGKVFLARDIRLGRLVAIKLLLEHDGKSMARFLVEARTTAQCKHENIVVIYDVDEIQGSPYMVLEYVEGRTLRDLMCDQGRVMVAQAVDLMLPVARALTCAHAMGIVHRDLKPENILLTRDGKVKVVDFGIAKRLVHREPAGSPHSDVRAGHLDMTANGAFIGTVPYMSPEQLLAEAVDERSDIWAVGIILHELALGAHPIQPLTLIHLAAVADIDTDMPSAQDRLGADHPLAEVIDRCLKKRKEERIGSAEELVKALLRIGAPRRELVRLEDDECPFAGLSAFQESDAALFFGRDDDIVAVTRKLRHQPLVAVAGASGAGKSSFVRAGVIPALKRAGQAFEAFVVRPGRRPLGALADVLTFATDSIADPTVDVDPEAIVSVLRAQPGYLGARLRARCRKRGSDHRILLFVDQLEELYTLGIEASERAAFCACIDGVADDASSPLRVVVTIRADFLDRISEDRRLLSAIMGGLVLLPMMTKEGLREAVQNPLEAVHYRFDDDDLVDEMLDGLAGTKSPLPLLQFTATKLWESRNRENRLLTRQAYGALGGVAGALSTHADGVFLAMSPLEQRHARAILLRLVTPERTRAVVRFDELCALSDDVSIVEDALHHLADARLISIETDGDCQGKTVELTHESLIDRWGKLGQWLNEHEQDSAFLLELSNAASQWEKHGKSDDFLWRDRAAGEARAFLSRKKTEVGETGMLALGRREVEYLEAVVRIDERTKRRRTLILGALFGSVLVIAVVVGLLSIYARMQAKRADEQARRADEQAKQAKEEARQARNATRMAAARELSNDPTTMVALLREVEGPSMPYGYSDIVRDALYGGVAEVVIEQPEPVMSVAFSRDGKRLVAAGYHGAAWVWNADGTGRPLILRGHALTVHSAEFSPDGQHVVTASADKTVRVWNVDGTGEPLILRGHDGIVKSATYTIDGKHIVTASMDRTVRIWNADGTGERVILRGHDDAITSAAMSHDQRRIVTVSADKTARIWNIDDQGKPMILRGHHEIVTLAEWSPDDKWIATASEDKTVRIWDTFAEAEPVILRGHEDGVWSATWSPDGQWIVSTSYDKTARVWDVRERHEIRMLRGHRNTVTMAAFSPDGNHIVTSSFDDTLRIWPAREVNEPLVLRGHEGDVCSAAFSPDGRRIVSSSLDKTARIWNVNGHGEPTILRGHEDKVLMADFSPDGKYVLTASRDKTARIWFADGTGEPLIFRGHEHRILSARWSPDQKKIVTASFDKTVRIWNVDQSGEPTILRGHEDAVSDAEFSPDGRYVATASFDKTARIWRADGQGEPILLRGHDSGLWSAAWSPDQRLIVTASMDKTARVFQADGKGEPLVLRGHEHWVMSAFFSHSGSRIITSSKDKAVRVWNADGRGEPLVLRGAAGAYDRASISPDDRRIAAPSADRTISVWSDLVPFDGSDDDRLWNATTYCIPIANRVKILGVSEAAAGVEHQACMRAARAPRTRAPTPP